jgi:tetratricopeptide (TPR) repeat protein
VLRASYVPLAFDHDLDTLWSFGKKRARNQISEFKQDLGDAASRIAKALSIANNVDIELKLVDGDYARAGIGHVAIGSTLLCRLDDACLKFAYWLVKNYAQQTTRFGPSVPLPILCSAKRFPEAVLALCASNLTPKTFDPLGWPRSDYEMSMAMPKMSAPRKMMRLSDFAEGSGFFRLPSHKFDLNTNLDPALNSLSGDEPFPHLLLLYARILTDTLSLVIAHEISHILLGHVGSYSDAARSREEEVMADRRAIDLIEKLAGADLRSAILLFTFLGAYDVKRESTAQTSHPLSSDRLALLAAGAKTRVASRMIEDLNAGLQLLMKHVEAQGASGAVAATDLNFSAFLRLELLAEQSTVQFAEVSVDLSIRDRIHPATKYRTGRVTLFVENQPPSSPGVETAMPPVQIDVPPSWWLDQEGASLTVDHVRVRYLRKGVQAVGAQSFECATRLSDLELERLFEEALREAPARAELAARRAFRSEDQQVALRLGLDATKKLGVRDADLVEWLAITAISSGQEDAGGKLLEAVLHSWPYVPASIRRILGSLKLNQFEKATSKRFRWPWQSARPGDISKLETAFDLLSRSLALEPGVSAAQKDYFNIIRQRRKSRLISAVISSTAIFHEGSQLSAEGKRQEALPYFSSCVKLLEEAIASVKAEAPYAWQTLGEALFAKAAHSDFEFGPAIDAFEKVVKSDPSFLPAWTELAKVRMEQGNLVLTDFALKQAEALSPTHEFVTYVRTEYRRRLAEAVEKALTASLSPPPDDTKAVLAPLDAVDVLRPLDLSIDFRRAAVKYQAGDLRTARQLLEEYLNKTGDEFDVLVLLGLVLIELGDNQSAYEHMTLGLGAAAHLWIEEHNTDDLPHIPLPYSSEKGIGVARAIRALALARLGAVARAETEAEAALKIFPNGGLVLLCIAEMRLLHSERAAAVDLAHRALEADDAEICSRHVAAVRDFIAGSAGLLTPSC